MIDRPQITSLTTLSELQALMTEHKLDVRAQLCPNGFHMVLVLNDEESWADNSSWSSADSASWTALDDAFESFWESDVAKERRESAELTRRGGSRE